MQLSFEKLKYQDDAVDAVIDTLSSHDDTMTSVEIEPDTLDDSVRITLSENNQQYPGRNYLEPFPQFNIEMETGTGKTMVYLKTIMELHRRFNENKFVIVVPSRAIKAGVSDSLSRLRVYLSNVHNTDKYHFFIYDSKQISQLQAFEGKSFEIMVTTIQAFNSNNNVINQEYSEGFWGGKPIDQIRNSNPIVIIDEPQSVDGAIAGKKAIKSLNPKLVLRYSATHKDKTYPLLYEFGPIQAYQSGMVKHIETLGTEVDTSGNIPFIELKSIERSGEILQAKVIAYKAVGNDFVKRQIVLKKHDSLSSKSKNSRYDLLGEVTHVDLNNQFIQFENGQRFEMGFGDGEDEIWLNAQLRALITDHLDRELNLQKKGIKVLSLIFLDTVANYRIYTDKGVQNGKYATLFESIYNEVLHSNPKYKKLNDYNVPASQVHDGYFSMDKATKNNSAKYMDTKGDTIKDESAYKAIMADKIGLLTQYTPNNIATDTKAAKLRFIFSHSALKEGWDNPNVFQILTITTPTKDLTRRQKIGRGLRISVNQDGERVYGNHNVVTIYANETFEEFARGLQEEYIDSGILKRKINAEFFVNTVVDRSRPILTTIDENGVEVQDITDMDDQKQVSDTIIVNSNDANTFVNVLKKSEIIQSDGSPKVNKIKKLQLEEEQVKLVNQAVKVGINEEVAIALVQKTCVQFNLPKTTNRKQRETVEITNKNNQYFVDLWDKIAHKVSYHVNFNEAELITDIVKGDNPICNIRINNMTSIQTRARIKVSRTSINDEIIGKSTSKFTWADMPIIDVTRQIADKVGLTRQAIIEIIKQSYAINSGFLDSIKKNPALFVRRATVNIQVHQRKLLNKSLVYVQSDDLWSPDEFKPYEAAGKNLWQVPDRAFVKTLFKQIVVQSEEEANFAEELVNEEKIKYFLKLPNWFKIPTPFGSYNPDWAILAESNDMERLYFVVDTKTTLEMGELNPREQDRLNAGKLAFQSEGFNDVSFDAPIKVVGDLNI